MMIDSFKYEATTLGFVNGERVETKEIKVMELHKTEKSTFIKNGRHIMSRSKDHNKIVEIYKASRKRLEVK